MRWAREGCTCSTISICPEEHAVRLLMPSSVALDRERVRAKLSTLVSPAKPTKQAPAPFLRIWFLLPFPGICLCYGKAAGKSIVCAICKFPAQEDNIRPLQAIESKPDFRTARLAQAYSSPSQACQQQMAAHTQAACAPYGSSQTATGVPRRCT
eukprot:1161333-Pelagomonas_calceolata.AAC.11